MPQFFGHEIASHTVSHTDLSTLSDEAQTNELKNSQISIKANVPGQKCLTLAYPNCVEAKESGAGHTQSSALCPMRMNAPIARHARRPSH